jgi:hypothetical protein
MTSASNALIEDSISTAKRNFTTQPFTNYNVMVFDQNLKNNSYISLINTNVYQPDGLFSANVSGLDFRLVEKSNYFAFTGKLNITQRYHQKNKPEYGEEYFLGIQKVSGKVRYGISRLSRSDGYDPNDLGFLLRNNETINKINLGYYEYKPVWKLLNWFTLFELLHSSLYTANKFAELSFNLSSSATLKNNTRIGIQGILFPVERHDYYESREEGWVFMRPSSYEVSAWYLPDYKVKFGIGITAALQNSYSGAFDQRSYYFKLTPDFRPNDKFRIGYDLLSFVQNQDVGFVDNLNDYILFGKRDINTLVNTLSSSYIFNNKTSLTVRLRHYWSTAVYDDYYKLRMDGYLDKIDYAENYDINYNSFNVDLIYTWNFAPGSELSIMWKNMILNDDNPVSLSYFENLNDIISRSQTNSLSIKLLYYIDYQNIKKKFTG